MINSTKLITQVKKQITNTTKTQIQEAINLEEKQFNNNKLTLIDVIPIGKKNKETRDNLMYKAKIMDIRTFRKELAELRKQYIIICDDGYYIPSSHEEYLEFIKKSNSQIYDITETINLAYKRMEELDNV